MAFLALGQIFSHGMRSVSLNWNYGLLKSKIPVLALKKDNPTGTPESSSRIISSNTPVIVLGEEAFYFGDLSSFTKGYRQIRDKYKVPHQEGSPQMIQLQKAINRWKKTKKLNKGVKTDDFAILLPSEQWPVAVITQIMSFLKQYSGFRDIILASELT